jgi:hypothetical protein
MSSSKALDINEYLFNILDEVTSDDFVSCTGNDYFYQLHADIIAEHFDGDWHWEDAIKFWSQAEISMARCAFQQAA